jgi:hypothetical protein
MTTNSSAAAVACAASSVIGDARELQDCEFQFLVGKRPAGFLAGGVVCPTIVMRYAWDDFDGGCQIEVDVDSIPPVTFWELDKYVKEKVDGRGRGPWSDDLMEMESGVRGEKRKTKSF